MSISLQEYLQEFRAGQSKTLLRFYGEVDSSVFGFAQAVMATLCYQGKEVNEQNITAVAVDKMRRFYSKCPLEANHYLDNIVLTLISRYSHDIDKSKSLFDWIVENVRYGRSNRGAVGYRTSLETLSTQEAVCGEMSILFVAMASLAGIPSAYVPVRRDMTGQAVCHACASMFDQRSNLPILVDPAYKKFGVKHLDYIFIDHQQLNSRFVEYRKSGLADDSQVDLNQLRKVFPD